MAHFYFSGELVDTARGDTVTVTGAEARHAVTVGRLREGETIRVGNGRGLVATGTVRQATPNHFTVAVESVETTDAPKPGLWLAQALAKGDRDELAIQAATELGVDGVIPWAAQRSIVRWTGPKAPRHAQRWESVLREAGKQSMRARFPELRPLASTAELAALGSEFQLVALEPTASTSLTALPADGRDILLIVGPEGGIAPSELATLISAGAASCRLGDSVLRTSTAGPAAIAVLSSALGRW